ncbi:MAG: pyruvate:ferredoxin (flavodoxin) oxidoreductase [Bacteroidaceae bacterium]|nr:pyruvate:ferredoxin (flavodoxin) oxidoreductase [Bacteroidaceae bacterium]
MEEKKLITIDGNEAAAHIAYDFTEIAAIYPITPSSPMAEHTDFWSAKGRKNIFGQTVTLTEMQSEAGAIAAVHGAAQTGSLATSFTSSQGLMLMIPVLHRIAGERLPVVLHVAARTVGTHAMSIFGDHSDVMCCRNTGFAMMCSGSVQEVIDLAAVAHLAAIKGSTPFMHFFDGFRTSHEINTVDMIDTNRLHSLLDRDALAAFRAHALNPEHPLMRSTVQNPDVYFQVREACNTYYNAMPQIVEDYLGEINKITGRDYHLFNYYGAADATDIIVAMGSVSGAVKEAVDHLNAQGKKTGFVQVHLYRPFSAEHLFKAMPSSVKRVAVLDRCKEPGSAGEPLYEDFCAAVANNESLNGRISIIGGRYGLSSKDTDPGQILAVFANLESPQPKNGFTIGINDDVTHLSLPSLAFHHTATDMFSCKFWGLGGDGTVGANKNTVHIVSDTGGMYGQAYFEYDAKKSFGVTKSHLRFSHRPIESSYYVKSADFVACHNQSYIGQYDIVSEIKPGGSFLLNCGKDDEELKAWLPSDVKRVLAERNIHLYAIDATKIAMRLGLGNHTNTVLQAAFFAVAGLIDSKVALDAMKAAARQTYFAKGEKVINENIAAIECGASEVREIAVPAEWAEAESNSAAQSCGEESVPDVVRNILRPINRQKGDDLPVSSFLDCVDGTIQLGLTAYEKRGIAVKVPKWNAEKCIQCNRCSLVCPHAVIRPYLLNDEEKAAAPEGFTTIPANGSKAKGLHFSLAVSDLDCTGCGSCAECCPVDALEMQPAQFGEANASQYAYGLTISNKGDLFEPYTIKGSQFRRPLVEYSAACAGCGETPYAKLLTQLFGDRVFWANATGCSQAWGAAMPGIPYTVNQRGFGPAWTNSLFENNAELCLGMFLSVRQRRNAMREKVEALKAQLEEAVSNQQENPALEIIDACNDWLASFDDLTASRQASDRLIQLLGSAPLGEAEKGSALAILQDKDMLAKKTFWMYGGDGWAYDIGFGGLDHVIASGENVNVFVIDTEMYSNTGGQSSKATPIGAVAKFASSGKRSRKKDLGAIMMTYGNVYVAQVAMGADPAQLIKALREAEEYDGPSVIVAYTPCASHGLTCGMHRVQNEMKRAVESGYWLLYRYDPRREHPFQLDSKQPTMSYTDFLDGEVRYASLRRTFPENADSLFAKGTDDAQERYDKYRAMSEK